MEFIVNCFHDLVVLSRFISTTIYGMADHRRLHVGLDPVNQLIFRHCLNVSWTMLSKYIVNQLLHVTGRAVLTLTSCHDVSCPIVTFIHEVLSGQNIRIIYLPLLHHSFISAVSNLAISPFLTHIKVIFILLFCRPISTFQPLNRVEINNPIYILLVNLRCKMGKESIGNRLH